MDAQARLATESTGSTGSTEDSSPGGGGGRLPGTRIRVLRSAWPLMLRPTLPGPQDAVTAWTHRHTVPVDVHLSAGAAGPLGGDRLSLAVDVGPGSALTLGEVAPTLLLPGRHGAQSRLGIDIRVGAGATLTWLPELVIAAHGCRHRTDIRISLARGARLLLREEVLLGRHGERPGAFSQHIRLEVDGRPLYDQEFTAGPSAPGWDGPAVTGGQPCIGSVLLVDPELYGRTDAERASGPAATALMTLPEPGMLITSLAPDTTTLRRGLNTALTSLLDGPGTRPDSGLPPAGPAVEAPVAG
ncbi:urease accessory protein UreD [Streptomyces sp. SID10853]|uniref:urease accessory protein UreD n=1 Tax=Streptomyces sp. SID10853 TaxID=2706028 RepID=UPI0013C1748B|nr:urease accessory protein UreD [Streptomyces sp. SID10853]NDZ79519.1 urease accessory protein UreD [Streptomyces sp. SID10853]